MQTPAPLGARRAISPYYPVVIVGAGPTGLTLANLLGHYGISALLVERNLTTVQEPRAVSIDDESLRTLQAIDLAEIVTGDVIAGYGSEYRTSSGRCFLRVRPSATPYGYARRNAFRQPVLEAQLREGLTRFEQVQSVFGWQLTHFTQTPSEVTVDLAGPGCQRARVVCDYLIGADGASSAVRTRLGIELVGDTFNEQWLIVDLEKSPCDGPETQVYCDSRRPRIALPGPGHSRRFEFKLMPGETPTHMASPAVVAGLLAAHGAHPNSVIKRTAVYAFHARVASQWSAGRVYLAGDACHLTPPFAGQGMNSGIRDAFNLGWKLAATLRGRLGPGLLATYAVERRDHVIAMIQLALRMGRLMAPANRLAGALTQTAFRLLSVWPAARNYFGAMKYKPAPRFAQGLLVSDGLPRRRSVVGCMVPQPFVMLSGASTRLDDVLGDGFAVLGMTSPERLDSAIGAHPLFHRLGVRRIAVIVGGAPGYVGQTWVIEEPSGVLAALAQGTEQIFLIRPDRYVAGAFALADVANFVDRMAALIDTLGTAQAERQTRLPSRVTHSTTLKGITT